MRELMGSDPIKDATAIERVRIACVEHLRTRASEPLEPPKDWQRSSAVGCKCAHCDELSRFLADPAQKTWVLKAAQANRLHVEQTIKQARCDVNATTERRGSPHSLVCTKNQATYERRKKQRKDDLAGLERLDA
jgi:hypothetical protein